MLINSRAPNRRLPVIREYRKHLAEYLFQGTGDHDELVQMYKLAEKYYESDLIVEGDPQEREQIEQWIGRGSSRFAGKTISIC